MLLLLYGADPRLKEDKSPEVIALEIARLSPTLHPLMLEVLSFLKAPSIPTHFPIPPENAEFDFVKIITTGNLAIQERLTPKPVYKKFSIQVKAFSITFIFTNHDDYRLSVKFKRLKKSSPLEKEVFKTLYHQRLELSNQQDPSKYIEEELADFRKTPRFVYVVNLKSPDGALWPCGFCTLEVHGGMMNSQGALIPYIRMALADQSINKFFPAYMPIILFLTGFALYYDFDFKYPVYSLTEAATSDGVKPAALEGLESSLLHAKWGDLLPQACSIVYNKTEQSKISFEQGVCHKEEPLRSAKASSMGKRKKTSLAYPDLVSTFFGRIKKEKKSVVFMAPHTRQNMGALKKLLNPLGLDYLQLAASSARPISTLLRGGNAPIPRNPPEEKIKLLAKL